MCIERIIQLLKIEKECVSRNSNNLCDRKCDSCDLVQSDKELLEMYAFVIVILEKLLNILN